MITYNKLIEGKTAFTKALELKPKTVRVDKDTFAVAGYNDLYLVEINDAPLFDTVIACECQAGKLKKACYHAASVLMLKLTEDGDKRRAEQEAAAAAAKAAEPVYFNFDIDFNDLDQVNAADMNCLRDTPANKAIIDKWFDIPASRRAGLLFADFAGM
jgi:hypothetical protein